MLQSNYNWDYPQTSFNNLINSKDIFSFAETKGEMLNFVIDKKTESCIKKLIKEIFMYLTYVGKKFIKSVENKPVRIN